jgi:hypothetical protein
MLRSLIFAIAAVLLIPASYPLCAQVSGNRVTCTGTLNIKHTVCYTELSPTRFKNFWRE